MNPLTIVVHIKTTPEQIDFVKSELEILVPLTRQEKGCILYDMHQDNDNPEHFMFYETWESRELWQEHIQSAHIQNYRAKTQEAVVGFELYELTKIA